MSSNPQLVESVLQPSQEAMVHASELRVSPVGGCNSLVLTMHQSQQAAAGNFLQSIKLQSNAPYLPTSSWR